jgi:hypothetical protein
MHRPACKLRCRTAALVVASLVTVALLVVLASMRLWRTKLGPYNPALGEIEALTGLQFPAGSELVGSYHSSRMWQGWFAMAKVRFAASSSHRFRSSMPPAKPTDDAALRMSWRTPPPDWWDPQRARRQQTYTYTMPHDWRVYIKVCSDDPATVTTYVLVSGG